MPEPRTEAGRRLLDALDGLVGFVAALASADLPDDLARQAKMPDQARREFARTICDLEAEAAHTDADVLDVLAERVRTMPPNGVISRWENVSRSAVIDLLLAARAASTFGRDGE